MSDMPALAIDLRTLASPLWHERFLRAFLRLSPGETFTMLTDEDPTPRLYSLRLIYGEEFECRILETTETGVLTAIVRHAAVLA